RKITDRAIAGTFAATESVDADDDVRTWVERIVSAVKEAMPDLETELRVRPDDVAARASVVATLDRLQTTVRELFDAYPEPGAATFAEKALRSELQPYLARSSLAERALRRPHGRIGTVQILAQAQIGIPLGDGLVGQLVDEWMLDRPTFAALRAMQPEVARTVLRGVPDDRRARVLVLNVGTGSMVSSLVDGSRGEVTYTVVDQSPRALALLDAPSTKPGVEVLPVKTNVVALASGGVELGLPPQDIIVLHHLLEVLPERVAVTLIDECRRLLAPDGALVVATLGPSSDRVFLDRVLGWPTIRRSQHSLDDLLKGAGFTTVTPVSLREPGQLLVALGQA
ncbi:MAG: methyltransferase domain-containing protein, partial [Myxococcota bacterium]